MQATLDSKPIPNSFNKPPRAIHVIKPNTTFFERVSRRRSITSKATRIAHQNFKVKRIKVVSRKKNIDYLKACHVATCSAQKRVNK
jgi:hypothetical protein